MDRRVPLLVLRRSTNSTDSDWEQSWSEAILQRVRDLGDPTIGLIDADELHGELRSELQRSTARSRDIDPDVAATPGRR